MSVLRFQCPQCEAVLEIEAPSSDAAGVCPECGQEIRIPAHAEEEAHHKLVMHHHPVAPHPGSRPKGPPVALLAFLALFVLFCAGAAVSYVVFTRRQHRFREAQALAQAEREQAAAAQAQAQAAADQARWEAIEEMAHKAAAGETEIAPALARAQQAGSELPEQYAERLDALAAELEQARGDRAEKAFDRLATDAEERAAEHDFRGAAEICASYGGEYAAELRERLASLAGEYSQKAVEADQACDEMKKVLAWGIVDGDFAGCLEDLAGFEYRKSLSRVEEALRAAQAATLSVLASFTDQQGKVVPIEVGGKVHQVRIVAVEGDRILTEKRVGDGVGRRVLVVGDLDAAEQARRLGPMEGLPRALYLGAAAVQGGDFRQARAHFAQAGDLSKALLERLETVRLAEELAAAAKTHAPIPPPETATPPPQPAGEDTPEIDINPRHIDMRAIVHKRTRDAHGWDYDDQRQRVFARITLKNGTGQDLKDLRTELYIIGESVTDGNVYKLLKRIEQKISVAARRQVSTEETQMSILFDDNRYAQYGHKYYGYIILLKDAKGRLLAAKLSRTRFRELETKIGEFKEGMCFDREGRRLRGAENESNLHFGL